ncbi:MAG: tetratricopeptide repeat protein [Candidatus Aminicenantes bacterium]|nr:MAG: tetratricopeptide repeat protein [Candidatus Aminicenantes bacterium]
MERKVMIFLILPFLLGWHWFEPAAKKNREGMKAYQDEKYDEALKKFLSAKGINPDLAQLKSNTASALYQMKKYKEALEEFSTIDPEKANVPGADFYYNLGNSFFRLNQFDKALENYKKSLILNSDDMNAKKNFELTLKKIQEQKQKQNQDKKQDKDKKKEKEKQQQEQKKDKEKEQQQQQQQQQQKKEEKHQNIMQYLNQNEKKQMEKKKRKIAVVRKEKDW